jgi:hypothetical protein
MRKLFVYDVLGFSADGSSVKKVRGVGRTMLEAACSVVLVEHLQWYSVTVINPATKYKRTFNLNDGAIK